LKGPLQPRQIGRYEIRKELGRGMMGVVYEAHDPALGRTIALKTIRLTLAASDREREDYEQRFLAEARIAAGLSHPGIVVVHDVGRDAEHGILYIALEYLHGRTLAEMSADGPLEWRVALRLVGRVAEALQYAHAKGVVHRDIKPANIMVVASGMPKIMDFGIAKLESAHLTSTGQFFGTPLYMSPEQALGQPVDARADLFSLGSVAYMLLAGRPPFDAPNVPGILNRVAYQQAKPLAEFGRDIPPDVEYVVGRAMSKDAADRYPEARTLAEDVEDVLAGRAPRHRSGWTPPETGAGTLVSHASGAPPRLRRRRAPRFALVLLLAGVVAAYFYLRPADARFWQRAAAAARRAPIVQQARALWAGLISLAAPAPPPPVRATAAPTTGPRAATVGPIRPPPPVTPAPTQEPPVSSAPPAEAFVPRPESPLGSPTATHPAAQPAAPGRLAIEFEHHLRRGNLQVWVDDERVCDEDFDGRVTRKILALKLRRGVVEQVLTLEPGRHEVRVQVKWDDNVKTGRISGTFAPGATRRLDVAVGRIRGKLSLDWK
jgi:eukaryotic-like serine/threonine-protein kinase